MTADHGSCNRIKPWTFLKCPSMSSDLNPTEELKRQRRNCVSRPISFSWQKSNKTIMFLFNITYSCCIDDLHLFFCLPRSERAQWTEELDICFFTLFQITGKSVLLLFLQLLKSRLLHKHQLLLLIFTMSVETRLRVCIVSQWYYAVTLLTS